jgi:hypothetical protein
MWHIWGRREMHVGFMCGNLSEKRFSPDLDIEGTIILKSFLKQKVGRPWTRLIWLRIGTRGWLL